MRQIFHNLFLILFVSFILISDHYPQQSGVSPQTEECLGCHEVIHPGIVESWYKSRHSAVTPAEGLAVPLLEQRISSREIKRELMKFTVGCYECHSLNTADHKDAFEHNGYVLNVVVSPRDCAVCHAVEDKEYKDNLMSHAYSNLMENALYKDLMQSINNPYNFQDNTLIRGEADKLTDEESCLYCHGTKIEVTGQLKRETEYGEFSFPVLSGWPNQGVGRINPDDSKGSCTSCHPRHDFSIETARKPYTCSECHKGPDVPAYKIYEVSKHGNIFSSKSSGFSFSEVPWKVGKDFTVPTCAACHSSLLVSPDNNIIAERTHRFNDRLSWRLFGVPYAHPHPVNADRKDVKNSQGLPLLVELTGEPVSSYVIDSGEQLRRNNKMKKICLSCHSSEWADNHFVRLDNTIKQSNALTLQATKMLTEVWQQGFTEGLPQGKSIFDDEIERVWVTVWLFHANSTRFASAMAGGGDYGVFADGRFQSTGNLFKLMETLKASKLSATKEKSK